MFQGKRYLVESDRATDPHVDEVQPEFVFFAAMVNGLSEVLKNISSVLCVAKIPKKCKMKNSLRTFCYYLLFICEQCCLGVQLTLIWWFVGVKNSWWGKKQENLDGKANASF